MSGFEQNMHLRVHPCRKTRYRRPLPSTQLMLSTECTRPLVPRETTLAAIVDVHCENILFQDAEICHRGCSSLGPLSLLPPDSFPVMQKDWHRTESLRSELHTSRWQTPELRCGSEMQFAYRFWLMSVSQEMQSLPHNF